MNSSTAFLDRATARRWNDRMIKFAHSLLSRVLQWTAHRRLARFYRIKADTQGMLHPRVYEAIYASALRAPEGLMVDIGPAQGGSSICLGLGIAESAKTRSRVYSIEKGVGSNALRFPHSAPQNAEVWSRNMAAYGVDHIGTLLLGDVFEVGHEVPDEPPISILFIDADGALDRDFKLFYDRLLPGATVIVDDYEDKINRHARDKYLHFTDAARDRYVRNKGAKRFRDVCPLGKEYTTFRFVNFFVKRGFLVQRLVIGKTFFGCKAVSQTSAAQFSDEDFEAIRKEIEDDYLRLRAGRGDPSPSLPEARDGRETTIDRRLREG